MRIAFVHNFHAGDVPSGENVVVDAEAAALRRAGHDVAVVSVSNDDMARTRLHTLRGAVTVATGFGRSPLPELEDFRPDVVHVHNLFPYFGHRWLAKSPAPVVTTLHSFRAMCANGYLFRDGEVCTLCPDGHRWSGVRHGCYRGSSVATIPLAIAARRGAAHDPLLSRSHKVLALSKRSLDLFASAGVPRDKLVRDWHFVPDGIAGSFDPARDPSRGAERWLFVGRLSPEKGVDRLVAEWPAGRSLAVVGDGPLRGEVAALAAGKAIDLLGAVSRADVLEAMEGAAGVVVPSRWYETFGLVYIEALSAGVPTMAFPPNVVADAVEEDRTGAVATWGEVAGALDRADREFPGLRNRCRRVFEDRYSEAAFVRRRLQLYEELGG